MVPIIHDKNASHPALMCSDDQHNLFLHCDSLMYNNIRLWQYCINERCGKDDQVSIIWSQSFFYESDTAELHERVDSKNKD